MKLVDYPEVTIILRGYTYEEINTVIEVLKESNNKERYALEISLNSPNVFDSITKLQNNYGAEFYIGAGTVLNLEDAMKAVDAGAEFILSPINLDKSIIDYCKYNNVLTIPAASTPTEIYKMKDYGADIVKVFPARALKPIYFKDIQSPLGKIPLMAVGGVNAENTKDYFDNGSSYVGIGSGIFNSKDIKDQNKGRMNESLNYFEDRIF